MRGSESSVIVDEAEGAGREVRGRAAVETERKEEVVERAGAVTERWVEGSATA